MTLTKRFTSIKTTLPVRQAASCRLNARMDPKRRICRYTLYRSPAPMKHTAPSARFHISRFVEKATGTEGCSTRITNHTSSRVRLS